MSRAELIEKIRGGKSEWVMWKDVIIQLLMDNEEILRLLKERPSVPYYPYPYYPCPYYPYPSSPTIVSGDQSSTGG